MVVTDGPLTYKQRERILRDAILGVPMKPGESPEAQAWRKECDEDVRKSLANGIMPEIPFDPTHGEDEGGSSSQNGHLNPSGPGTEELKAELYLAYRSTEQKAADEAKEKGVVAKPPTKAKKKSTFPEGENDVSGLNPETWSEPDVHSWGIEIRHADGSWVEQQKGESTWEARRKNGEQNQAFDTLQEAVAYIEGGVEMSTGLLERITAAAKETDPEPSEEQKKAGNYRKGHVIIQGLPITIEVAKGGIRRGTSPDGTTWERKMPCHYGYIRQLKA